MKKKKTEKLENVHERVFSFLVEMNCHRPKRDVEGQRE